MIKLNQVLATTQLGKEPQKECLHRLNTLIKEIELTTNLELNRESGEVTPGLEILASYSNDGRIGITLQYYPAWEVYVLLVLVFSEELVDPIKVALQGAFPTFSIGQIAKQAENKSYSSTIDLVMLQEAAGYDRTVDDIAVKGFAGFIHSESEMVRMQAPQAVFQNRPYWDRMLPILKKRIPLENNSDVLYYLEDVVEMIEDAS